jgi:hypothetical protein
MNERTLQTSETITSVGSPQHNGPAGQISAEDVVEGEN